MTSLGALRFLNCYDAVNPLMHVTERLARRAIQRFRLPLVDLAVTAANIKKDANAGTQTGTAGETITAGMPVYLDTTTTPNKYKKADGNDSLKYAAAGIALHAALLDQPLTIQNTGDITLGATTGVTMAAGMILMVSITAGGIMNSASADFTTGTYPCVLGIAISATVLRLNIFTGDVVVP